MPSMSRNAGAALLLAGSLCVLPFLVPYHQEPIRSFYAEWLAGALGVAAWGVLLTGCRMEVARLPAPATWLLCFGVLLAIRPFVAQTAYWQLSIDAAGYVLFAVCMMWLGAELV